MIAGAGQSGEALLALLLVDKLYGRLLKSGAIQQTEIDSIVADIETLLSRQNTVNFNGARATLRASKIGQ